MGDWEKSTKQLIKYDDNNMMVILRKLLACKIVPSKKSSLSKCRKTILDVLSFLRLNFSKCWGEREKYEASLAEIKAEHTSRTINIPAKSRCCTVRSSNDLMD